MVEDSKLLVTPAYKGNISSSNSSNSEANASELLELLEEIIFVIYQCRSFRISNSFEGICPRLVWWVSLYFVFDEVTEEFVAVLTEVQGANLLSNNRKVFD